MSVWNIDWKARRSVDGDEFEETPVTSDQESSIVLAHRSGHTRCLS